MAKHFFTNESLETFVDEIKSHVSDAVSTKANNGHGHSISDVTNLQNILDNKAGSTHDHDEYSLTTHSHTLADLGAASSTHNHDGVYATTTALSELSTTVSGKANSSHSHDDRYYTETEIDTKLSAKSDATHNHNSAYDTIGSASSALTSAQAYTDEKIANLLNNSTTAVDSIMELADAMEENADAIEALEIIAASKATASDLTSHTGNTTVHVTETEKATWNAKSNFSGNYNDLTNKPTIPSISGLATEVYVDEKVDGITAESIGALPNTTVIPTIPTNISSFTNDVGYLTEHQSLSGLATETYVDTQIDAIVIPDALSDLTADSTHRTVTDAEKAIWNAKSDFSGSYNDLTNKPSIPSIVGLATETYVDEAVSTKSNISHSHSIVDVNGLQNALNGKSDSSHNHNTSYDVLGAANTALASANEYTDDAIADEIVARDTAIATAKSSAISTASSDATTKANNALASAKSYADSVGATVKNELLNGAGTAYDTLKELGDLIDDNVDAIEALEVVASGKANSSDLTSHTNNSTIHVTNDNKNNWNTAYTHSQSAHAPSSAEPNQNAFSNVKVGSTTIAADSKTDTLTFVAGSNITLTPDATGDSITIASTNTVYTHPTTAGNKHIPAGGSSGQVLKWSADGTAVWGNDNNTTYSNATQTASGLMSDADKVKLDGIAVGANNYTLPSAGTNLGGVKSGGDVTISAGVITVNDDSHNHVISNIDGLQSALDGKASSSHTHSDVYTESEVDTLLSGKANSSHTHTIANITNLQSTLDGKANSSHGTHVSYSTTAPVMDGTASVGTASTVARSDHKHPTDTSRAAQTSLDSHTGNKSNPHGVTLSQLGLTATAAELNVLDGITATVTELNYVDGVTSNIQTQLNNKLSATGKAVSATTADSATNVAWSGVTSKPSYYDAKAIKSITRSGTTFTYTCMDGTTGTFTQQDNNTTYSAVTTSANGLMIASDKSKLDGMVLATVTEVEAYLGI